MTMLVILLAVMAFGGVAFALTGEDSSAKALKRVQSVSAAGKTEKVRSSQDAATNRRKQILSNLKAVEKQQRKQSLTLEARLQQAGLSPNVRMFWIVSLCVGGFGLLVGLVLHNMLLGFGLAFALGLGLPRWALGTLAKRRLKKFTAAFPDATDIIVRGVKSGLPVNDCLRIIAHESPKPLNDEVRLVVESLGMGRTMDEALEKMYARMPTAEVRFFAIVLSIQQKTGGNLAEALGNLSNVLRGRKMMREKIKAMAGEAVASAGIIGSLPPAILLLVQLTTPSYMAPLYTTSMGHILLMIGAFWMSMGVLVMRKMINFQF